MMSHRSPRPFSRPSRARSRKVANVVVRSTLHDDVQRAFERACTEQDFEVGEHLLRALEVIACRETNEQSPDRAYYVLAHCLGWM